MKMHGCGFLKIISEVQVATDKKRCCYRSIQSYIEFLKNISGVQSKKTCINFIRVQEKSSGQRVKL